jgi:hypothetical protein
VVELLLQRDPSTDQGMEGELRIDGQPFGYTMENPIDGVKPHRSIPAGRYKIIVDFSPKFQRNMIHVLNVPGFLGIRMHAGNTDADTEGCILVGWERLTAGSIGDSRNAVTQLEEQVNAAIDAHEEVWLTVQNAES